MDSTNAVINLGESMADTLGNGLYEGLNSAYASLNGSNAISEAQSSLAAILLMFVGIAALFYVGRWLYKAFKRGAA